VKDLLQRKADLKARMAALRVELQPHEARVENLRERIIFLESDLHEVLDAIRIAECAQRKSSTPVETVKTEWVRA
jgi:hypothetical protein